MQDNSEDHLPPFRVRPRFKIETQIESKKLEEKINIALKETNSDCIGAISHGFGTVHIPPKDQHYWSPQLTISIEDLEEGGSMIRGLYGPKPSVWTMFVFFYAVLGFAILIISIVGFSNLSLDLSGKILWLVPILILVFLSLYIVSYTGQRIGHDQMVILHHFMEEATGLTIDPKHEKED